MQLVTSAFFLLAALVVGGGQAGDSPARPKAELAADWFEQVVLVQGEASYTAGEVITAADRYNPGLLRSLENDEALRSLHLHSLIFLQQVRAFADLRLLDAAGVSAASENALLAEAKAWAADHGSKLLPEAALAARGLEIECRARLIAQQPETFSDTILRQHFNRSIPEFFGDLKASWIRVPLVNAQTGAVLPLAEQESRVRHLAEVARRISGHELSWNEAVERYSEDPTNKARNGYLGVLRRTMVERYEEPFLREAFSDLGVRALDEPVLRGPIRGDLWVYLLRMEFIASRGVVEMQSVRPRVERSLREDLLQTELQKLRAEVKRSIRLP